MKAVIPASMRRTGGIRSAKNPVRPARTVYAIDPAVQIKSTLMSDKPRVFLLRLSITGSTDSFEPIERPTRKQLAIAVSMRGLVSNVTRTVRSSRLLIRLNNLMSLWLEFGSVTDIVDSTFTTDLIVQDSGDGSSKKYTIAAIRFMVIKQHNIK